MKHIAPLLLLLLTGCGDKPRDTGPVPEADTDTDTDADTDADADADSDADTDPVEEIDCDDGVDNDGDGLLDCEDGDCAEDEICGERICDDGLDGDDDGLTDCEDDDCFAGCHPGGIRASVLGGQLHGSRSHRLEGRMSHYETWSGYHSWFWLDMDFSAQQRLDLRSVHGTVQVLGEGASDWTGGAPTTTCQWSFDSGSVTNSFAGWGWHTWGVPSKTSSPAPPSSAYYFRTTTMAVGEVARTGFALHDGCRLGGSWFIPQQLLLADQGEAWALDNTSIASSYISFSLLRMDIGALWYAGSVMDSSAVLGSSFGGWHDGSRWSYTRNETVEVALAEPPDAVGLDALPGLDLRSGSVHNADPSGLDLNQDGAADLVVSDYYDDLVLVFAGPVEDGISAADATASIVFSHGLGQRPLDLEGAADLDGDSIDDLALYLAPASSSGTACLQVFLGADDGSWAGAMTHADAWSTLTFSYAGYSSDQDLAAGPDLDGDGLGELALAQEDTVVLLASLSPGTHALADFAAATIETSDDEVEEAEIDFADIDGDGLAELIVGAYELDGYSGMVSIFDGPLAGAYTLDHGDVVLHGGALSGTGYTVAGVGDVDADGLEDLLVSSSTTSGGAVLFTDLGAAVLSTDDATASFASPFPGAAVLSVAEAGDLDRDGHADLLFYENTSDYDTIWLWGRPRNLTGWLLLGPAEGAIVLDQPHRRWLESMDEIAPNAAGDLDGDGWGDLLFTTELFSYRQPALWFFEP